MCIILRGTPISLILIVRVPGKGMQTNLSMLSLEGALKSFIHCLSGSAPNSKNSVVCIVPNLSLTHYFNKLANEKWQSLAIVWQN